MAMNMKPERSMHFLLKSCCNLFHAYHSQLLRIESLGRTLNEKANTMRWPKGKAKCETTDKAHGKTLIDEDGQSARQNATFHAHMQWPSSILHHTAYQFSYYCQSREFLPLVPSWDLQSHVSSLPFPIRYFVNPVIVGLVKVLPSSSSYSGQLFCPDSFPLLLMPELYSWCHCNNWCIAQNYMISFEQ